MTDLWDIVIAGGGPAGSAAAITAARAGAKVLLLERGRFPRAKVCGEFVSSESLALLDDLLPNESALRQAPFLDTVELIVGKDMLKMRVNPPARSISRRVLDGSLWGEAERSAARTLEGVTVRSVRASRDGFQVQTSAGMFSARACIDATGRWSELSRTALPSDRWIGIKRHYRAPWISGSISLFFAPRGYCGVQPIGDGCINVSAMVRPDAATEMDEVLALFPALQRTSQGWEPLGDTVRTAPLFFRVPQARDRNILRAGDAAGFIDPFVGDGISIALQTGVLAARRLLPFLHDHAPLDACADEYARNYDRQVHRAITAAARLRRLLASPAAIRRLAFQAFRLSSIQRWSVESTRARLLA